MKHERYDLIGDIHGQYGKLEALLRKMDYTPAEATWKHAGGRKVIFLGDYVDRGPQVGKVLQTVRGMVEAGDALAIMGNHEYNAVCYHTPDGKGGHLRERTERNTRTHSATLAQFEGREAEWAEWIGWMRGLPFALDLGALRCVHACWDAGHLATLRGESLADSAFLHRSADKRTAEYAAIETVLKGPELQLPAGAAFTDKEGRTHRRIRVKWWGRQAGESLGEAALPVPMVELLHIPLADDACRLANYPADAPPVFFGHYWMPPESPKQPLTKNVACLDFGAGLTGPLVGYRWDGEAEVKAASYITHN